MSARGLLDADMQTLGRWFLEGWRWWVGELRALVPAGWRRNGGGDLPRFVFEEGRLIPQGRPARRGARVAILVPGRLCLARTVERPAISDADLVRMLTFEGEALLPFPAGSTLITGRRLGPVGTDGRMRIEVAGLPVATARTVLQSAEAAEVVPVRVAMLEGATRLPPLDFAPAMRGAGLLARTRSATPLLWIVVALLVAFNLGLWVWRDMASLGRLEQLVQEQQPAVSIAQAITRRADRDRALAGGSLALRRSHDALDGLAAASRALPDGAWLQRFAWDGRTVRLAGYKPPRTDVVTALRRSGRFSDIRSTSEEVETTVPGGEPFDVSARLDRR